MKMAKTLGFALCLSLSSGLMADTGGQPASSEYLVIQVNGIVCSFCAYGTEKNLSTLEFLDKTQYGKDGVLVDINEHRITLALQPHLPVHYAQINAAILKGGYDPVAYYAAVQGVVNESAGGYQLVNEANGQIYSLPVNPEVAALSGKNVSIRTVLDPEQVASIVHGQVIRLTSIELQP